MIFDDYPDGVPIVDVLNDLRWIKLSGESRSRVMALLAEAKMGPIPRSAEVEIRALARRRKDAVSELHKARDAVAVTDAKLSAGTSKLEAAKQERRNQLRRKLRDLEKQVETFNTEAEIEKKDFGF